MYVPQMWFNVNTKLVHLIEIEFAKLKKWYIPTQKQVKFKMRLSCSIETS